MVRTDKQMLISSKKRKSNLLGCLFTLFMGIVIGFVAAKGWLGFLKDKPVPPPAPHVERVVKRTEKKEFRYADTSSLLEWAREKNPVVIVENPVDAFPNGLAMTMVPFIVDWNRSNLDNKYGHYLIHNVSIGGNPVRGFNILATVKVPKGGIKSVEFVLARARVDGKDTVMGHGQLRFVFKHDKRPVVLTPEDGVINEYHLDDLILSWEAWRPPGTAYDSLKGLDPKAYGLTVRCFSGAQRFLLDSIRKSAWECFPLKLPEVDGAKDDLFGLCLMLGDGLARRVIDDMVKDGTLRVPSTKDLADWDEKDVKKLDDLFSRDQVPSDTVSALMGQSDLSYHLLLSSCITQALTAVDLAMELIHEKHKLRPRKRLKVAPEELPSWIDELSKGDKNTILSRIPDALYWVIKNQNVLPANAYKILQDGGLLYEENGQPLKYYYSVEGETPYGNLKQNMM